MEYFRDMRIFHSICLSVLVSALGAVVAISFGRFLGSEGSTIMTTPEFLITLFLLVFYFNCSLSTKGKKSLILFFFLCSFSFSVRSFASSLNCHPPFSFFPRSLSLFGQRKSILSMLRYRIPSPFRNSLGRN